MERRASSRGLWPCWATTVVHVGAERTEATGAHALHCHGSRTRSLCQLTHAPQSVTGVRGPVHPRQRILGPGDCPSIVATFAMYTCNRGQTPHPRGWLRLKGKSLGLLLRSRPRRLHFFLFLYSKHKIPSPLAPTHVYPFTQQIHVLSPQAEKTDKEFKAEWQKQ